MTKEDSSTILKHLQAFEKKVDKRFDAVDERFEKVDKRFGKIDKQFEKIDRRFDVIEFRLDTHSKEFQEIHKRLDNTATKQQVDSLIKTVDRFIKRLDDMEAENAARDHKIDRLEHWIEQIAEKTGVKLSYK